MKAFNLEQAKAGKLVCTRDGRDVVIYDYELDNSQPIVGKIASANGDEYVYQFGLDGKFNLNDEESHLDLFMKGEIYCGFCNVYIVRNRVEVGCTYDSEAEAQEGIDDSRTYLKTIKVEWED